jgi:hypothetical protein
VLRQRIAVARKNVERRRHVADVFALDDAETTFIEPT